MKRDITLFKINFVDKKTINDLPNVASNMKLSADDVNEIKHNVNNFLDHYQNTQEVTTNALNTLETSITSLVDISSNNTTNIDEHKKLIDSLKIISDEMSVNVLNHQVEIERLISNYDRIREVRYKNSWAINAVYNRNDVVTHNNGVYLSIKDANMRNEPGNASAFWLLLGSGSSGVIDPTVWAQRIWVDNNFINTYSTNSIQIVRGLLEYASSVTSFTPDAMVPKRFFKDYVMLKWTGYTISQTFKGKTRYSNNSLLLPSSWRTNGFMQLSMCIVIAGQKNRVVFDLNNFYSTTSSAPYVCRHDFYWNAFGAGNVSEEPKGSPFKFSAYEQGGKMIYSIYSDDARDFKMDNIRITYEVDPSKL